MIKLYGTRKAERELLPVLAEFRVRAFLSYPLKGLTKKRRGKDSWQVVNYPTD